MTFNPTVPNASQSPGLFPSQNNTNYTRLKTIINADHVFNDTAQANDGAHKMVTLVDLLADPVALAAGTNGILYTKVENGTSELKFYNGLTVLQLTPYDQVLPIRVMGSQNIASGVDISIFNPSYNWAGTAYAIHGSGLSPYNFYNLSRFGANTNVNTLASFTPFGNFAPSMFFTGTDLRIKNNDIVAQTVFWSLIINRFT